jgi:hypothetical protein
MARPYRKPRPIVDPLPLVREHDNIGDLVRELLFLAVQASPAECMGDIADGLKNQSRGGKLTALANLARRVASQEDGRDFLADLSRSFAMEAR